MTPEEFKEATAKAKNLLTVAAPKILGIEAKKHFQRAFQPDQQGFTDEKLVKWPDITEARKKAKRRKNGNLPPILTDKGHLRDSIQWEADYNAKKVVMSSNSEYAEVHDQGGGPKNMPRRQFFGESKVLERNVVAKIEKELDKIFK